MATGLTETLDYSQTQFYRRVHLLADAELVHPERGRYNQIILSEQDLRVLREFYAVEQNYAELSLEGCLGYLKARLLEEKSEILADQVTYLRAENRALKTALVRYRRWTIQRVLERVKKFFHRRWKEQD